MGYLDYLVETSLAMPHVLLLCSTRILNACWFNFRSEELGVELDIHINRVLVETINGPCMEVNQIVGTGTTCWTGLWIASCKCRIRRNLFRKPITSCCKLHQQLLVNLTVSVLTNDLMTLFPFWYVMLITMRLFLCINLCSEGDEWPKAEREQINQLVTSMMESLDEMEWDKRKCRSSLELYIHQIELLKSRTSQLLAQLDLLQQAISHDPDMVIAFGFLFKYLQTCTQTHTKCIEHLHTSRISSTITRQLCPCVYFFVFLCGVCVCVGVCDFSCLTVNIRSQWGGALMRETSMWQTSLCTVELQSF